MVEIIEILEKAVEENRRFLTVYESKLVAQLAGLPVTRMGLAKCESEAVDIARKIGFPVVLKIVSPDIVHKMDVGGVVLDLKNEEEVVKAYKSIIENVQEKVANARIEGVLVEEMLQPGVEVIVGGLRDRQFGPIVAFGLGGIFVEIFKDLSYGIAPVDEHEALDMIKNTKAYKILSGYRGKGPYDIKAITDLLVKTSRLIWAYRKYITEIDLNPVFVYEKGLKIADARIGVELIR